MNGLFKAVEIESCNEKAVEAIAEVAHVGYCHLESYILRIGEMTVSLMQQGQYSLVRGII